MLAALKKRVALFCLSFSLSFFVFSFKKLYHKIDFLL